MLRSIRHIIWVSTALFDEYMESFLFDEYMESLNDIAANPRKSKMDLPLYIQTHFLSYGCDNFLRINSRGERYPSALCG